MEINGFLLVGLILGALSMPGWIILGSRNLGKSPLRDLPPFDTGVGLTSGALFFLSVVFIFLGVVFS
jgi:hypothetical protein